MRPTSLLILAGLVACGGQTTGGGARPSVTGTVAGEPAPLTDGVGIVGLADSGNGVVSSYAGAILTNLPSTCAVLGQGGNPANAVALSLAVATPGARSGVPTGTYPIQVSPPSPGSTSQAIQASAQYVTQDATCRSTTDETATAGTVTLTSVSATLVAGSFDITFPSGDHLAGTFASPVCDAAINGQVQAQPVCKTY